MDYQNQLQNPSQENIKISEKNINLKSLSWLYTRRKKFSRNPKEDIALAENDITQSVRSFSTNAMSPLRFRSTFFAPCKSSLSQRKNQTKKPIHYKIIVCLFVFYKSNFEDGRTKEKTTI